MNTENKNFVAPFAVLSGVLVMALGATGFLWVKSNKLTEELAKSKDATAVQIAQLSSLTEAQRAEYAAKLESLTASVNSANSTASAAVGRARAEVQKQAEQLHKRIDQNQEEFKGEITQLKGADTEVASKITEVATNVSGVKTEVDGVKTDVNGVREQVATAQSALEQHGMELRRMTGDMGVMSDRIAFNSKDLEALRALGERNYFEFTLSKGTKTKKVGDMILTYKKADPKRNRYTVEVTADDRKVEKKDKTVNEPVQIYLAGNRQPSEIVINRVNKDEIVGYVSVPKVMVSRR